MQKPKEPAPVARPTSAERIVRVCAWRAGSPVGCTAHGCCDWLQDVYVFRIQSSSPSRLHPPFVEPRPLRAPAYTSTDFAFQRLAESAARLVVLGFQPRAPLGPASSLQLLVHSSARFLQAPILASVSLSNELRTSAASPRSSAYAPWQLVERSVRFPRVPILTRLPARLPCFSHPVLTARRTRAAPLCSLAPSTTDWSETMSVCVAFPNSRRLRR